MRRPISSFVGVLAVLAILVGVNALADRLLAGVQADVTARGLYSVSPGTRTVLNGLHDPITLRLFVSPSLSARIPAYGAYADHVRELLDRYAALAHGRLHVETFSPEPFSDTEDRALGYGLQAVPLEQNGEQVFFGLAGSNLLDDERTIGFFQPEREAFLEYDLTRLIYELSNPTRPVIAVMSPLPLDGDPRAMMRGDTQAGGPWLSMQQLRQTFTVRSLPVDATAIDPAIQVLVLAQPQHLPDATLYAVDQFVMHGGRLMLLVDPHSEAMAAQADPRTGVPPKDTAGDAAKLLDAWGIGFDPGFVVGDLDGAWRVRAGPDSAGSVDYVAWFNIRDGIAHDDPATADLQQVTVASAGALTLKAGAGVQFTPLLTSSRQSALLPVAAVSGVPDPAAILAGFKPDGQSRVIAARVRGVLHSAFAGPPDKAAAAPAYKSQTDGPANLVVVADTDILADRFWVRTADFFGQSQPTPFSDNGDFIANLAGTLAGSDALIGLRARGTSARPFDVVDAMQRQAEARYQRTAKSLQDHLDATRKQLADLRAGRGDARADARGAQQQAIDALTQDITDTRGRLRAVQFDLRRDISRLETNLRLFCIVLVPAVLTVLAVAIGLLRGRRRALARG